MKKLLNKIIIFFIIESILICMVVGFDICIVGSQYMYNYQASLLDKVKRLETIDEPKIIIVGHSNVAFGINSPKIEQELRMPVVNLGLHGGLSNAFHEEIAKLNINKGDVVIVCHSSFSDDDRIGDAALAWITVDCHKEIWKIIRKKDYKAMFLAYPDYFRSSFLLWVNGSGNKDNGGCYSRRAFNEYGDIVERPEEGRIDMESVLEKTEVPMPEINATCIKRLNKLNDFVKKKNATLVVAGYPIAYGKYSKFTADDFHKFQAELEKVLDCEVISDYTDYLYPYKYFYNSYLHLTEEGAEIRTAQLIDDLKNHQKRQ